MAKFYYVKRDLFDTPQGYCFAHCISNDFKLGAGIAVQFDKRYNMRDRLKRNWNTFDTSYVGKALKVDNVYNLITKERCFEKPTYQDLQSALQDMAGQIKQDGVQYLAMPKIGAGLDKLKWTIVLSIIKDVFQDNDDLEITICFLEDDPDFPEDGDNIQGLNSYFEDEEPDGEDWTIVDDNEGDDEDYYGEYDDTQY